MKERILIVDDDQEQCDMMSELLAQLDYAPTATTSPEEALDLIGREPFDAVLTDLEMAPLGGVELCSRLSAVRSDVPVIFVTGMGSMASAVSALRAGAYDFLNKPIDANVLGLALKRAIEHRRLTAEVKLLREASPDRQLGESMIGESAPIKRVKDLIDRVGPAEVSILVEGETGTGKELVARAVHRASSRKDGPFVAINCAAVPATLLESELFGHARGAFTDAKSSRDGLFVQATGGTLFLDEIGEMPLEMQAKLLRALQERVVRPVGANNEVAFDTRIIAATHRDLESEIAKRTFREDLYYRINVVKIPVPPLRDRGNDILLLAAHCLRKSCARSNRGEIALSPQVASMLISYEWPGNVRELENCIERAVALARFDQVSGEDLPEKIRTYQPKRFVLSADTEGEVLSLDELERRYILRALKVLGGNRSRAATLLGLDRRTLYRRLEKYEAEGGSIPPARPGTSDDFGAEPSASVSA
jgi:DNA-binding NtrC family response regulator